MIQHLIDEAGNYWSDGVTVLHGDCIEAMQTMSDDSVDAIVTDPPYGLGFMGQKWDTYANETGRRSPGRHAFDHVGGNHNPSNSADAARTRGVEARRFGEWCGPWTAECLRVLKPGGHLLAFGGTRTWHRLAVAVEDAGFEIRDSIAWLYGSGFPKSQNVANAIDQRLQPGVEPEDRIRTPEAAAVEGFGTALKPAFEPIVVARKPLAGTVAANVLAHGTGALNIDGCRIAGETVRTTRNTALGVMNDDGWTPTPGSYKTPAGGRWPANVVLDEDQAAALDAQTGTLKGGARPVRRGADTDQRQAYGEFKGQEGLTAERMEDGGGSRFFYVAKAPKKERPVVDGVAHPTVKPLALMRWLVRLVTPPGGLVLDPFAGSGTTVEAAMLEGFRVVGVERGPEYLPLIHARIDRVRG